MREFDTIHPVNTINVHSFAFLRGGDAALDIEAINERTPADQTAVASVHMTHDTLPRNTRGSDAALDIEAINERTPADQTAVTSVHMTHGTLPRNAEESRNQVSIPSIMPEENRVAQRRWTTVLFPQKFRSQWYGSKMVRASLLPTSASKESKATTDQTTNKVSLMIWLSVVYRVCHIT